MFWVVLGGIAVVLLVVGSVVSGVISVIFAPNRESLSPRRTGALTGLGVVAIVSFVVLADTAPGAWFLAPGAIWLVAFAVARNSAPLRETDQQRREREAAERKSADEERKRAAARKKVQERKRVDAYTKDGLALLERGKSAVDSVRATEAARDGWLGESGDLDFSADLALISDTLLQARRIEKVVVKSKAIPNPTPDDITMLRDAEKTVKTLRAEANHRVKILGACVKQAREIDRLLAEEREQCRFAAQRDEARRRLAAELYVAEVTPSTRESDAADAVAARVAAFRELKNIVDEKVSLEIDEAAAVEGQHGLQSAFMWVRRQLPFG